jgi:hypothetical protein
MCQADKMEESLPKRVVVLISSLTGVNRSYKLRQNRAINVLEGRGHAYEIVNGADPEQKERYAQSGLDVKSGSGGTCVRPSLSSHDSSHPLFCFHDFVKSQTRRALSH